MLELSVVVRDDFNNETSEFVTETVTLVLEHSLVSLSKWEAIFKKPFISKAERTDEEVLTYIKCMTISPAVSPEVYTKLSQTDVDAINEYINDKRSATWFADKKGPPNREVITSELIYYWMIALQIPTEFQHWHLNRLLTLIQVCEQKNKPAKKMNPREVAKRNRDLNQQRKAQMGTRG